MLEARYAHSNEIDDVDAAVSDILKQLDIASLQKYSAGIISYYADFAKTGVVQQLCKKLSFPVIGGTTSNSAIRGSKEDITLTVTVYTSDTIAFSAGISGSLQGEPFMPLEKLYKQLLEGKPEFATDEKPSLFLIAAPHFFEIIGDEYLAALSGLSGGIPIFGAVAFTHSSDFYISKTLYNGVEYDKALACLALWGEIKPRFFISDIPEEQIMHRRAVITDSYKNRIKRVNGIPVMEYLESVGFAKDGSIEESLYFPFILHDLGGSRLIRSIYGVKDGELLCSGAVPSGYSLGISFCDKDFVIASARKTAMECMNWLEHQDFSKPQSALVISCGARRWTLGSDIYAEIREIDAGLKDLPYHFIYSGGEFCPVYARDDKTVNYFFNYTLCIFVV